MEKLLCPSTMCIDFLNLAQDVKALDEAGVDIFHNDIMDGSFVPNMTLGINDVKAIRRCTKKPVDVHLMIENPGSKVDWFIDAGADIVYIHPESERYTGKTLRHIRQREVGAGIAVNPDTALSTIEPLLNLCDYVMIMTVDPGFAGQKFLDFTKEKVKALGKAKARYGYKLMIDGACSPGIIAELSALGADGFVLGTSALFGKGRPYAELVPELRAL